jgi:hypothetical protein
VVRVEHRLCDERSFVEVVKEGAMNHEQNRSETRRGTCATSRGRQLMIILEGAESVDCWRVEGEPRWCQT